MRCLFCKQPQWFWSLVPYLIPWEMSWVILEHSQVWLQIKKIKWKIDFYLFYPIKSRICGPSPAIKHQMCMEPFNATCYWGPLALRTFAHAVPFDINMFPSPSSITAGASHLPEPLIQCSGYSILSSRESFSLTITGLGALTPHLTVSPICAVLPLVLLSPLAGKS